VTLVRLEQGPNKYDAENGNGILWWDSGLRIVAPSRLSGFSMFYHDPLFPCFEFEKVLLWEKFMEGVYIINDTISRLLQLSIQSRPLYT
jgi:hypothetical protein